jgi:ABC-type microcin C transport system permease subunit YejB
LTALFFIYIGLFVSGINGGTGLADLFIAYLSVSISLNMALTALIVGKLLALSRKTTNALGAQFGSTYSSIAAIVIESALPYSLLSLIFLVLFIKHSAWQSVVYAVLYQLVVCALSSSQNYVIPISNSLSAQN